MAKSRPPWPTSPSSVSRGAGAWLAAYMAEALSEVPVCASSNAIYALARSFYRYIFAIAQNRGATTPVAARCGQDPRR